MMTMIIIMPWWWSYDESDDDDGDYDDDDHYHGDNDDDDDLHHGDDDGAPCNKCNCCLNLWVGGQVGNIFQPPFHLQKMIRMLMMMITLMMMISLMMIWCWGQVLTFLIKDIVPQYNTTTETRFLNEYQHPLGDFQSRKRESWFCFLCHWTNTKYQFCANGQISILRYWTNTKYQFCSTG